jgi:hypothetical protein
LAALVLSCAVGLSVLAVSGIRQGEPLGVLAFFVLWNVAYVSVVGNLFENFENMRFRLEVEPLMLIAAAGLCGVAARTWRRRRPLCRGQTSEPCSAPSTPTSSTSSCAGESRRE